MTHPPVTPPHIDMLLVRELRQAQRLFARGEYEASLVAWSTLLGPRGDGHGPKVLAGRVLGTALLGRARCLLTLLRWSEALLAFSDPLLEALLPTMTPHAQVQSLEGQASAQIALGRWDDACESLALAMTVAAELQADLNRAEAIAQGWLQASLDGERWGALDIACQHTLTFARRYGKAALALRAGWLRVRALKGLGRLAVARRMALDLLQSREVLPLV